MSDLNFDNYEIEDFLLDDTFREWVISSNSLKHFQIENWIANNPHKLRNLEEARNLIISVENDKVVNLKGSERAWKKLSYQIETNENIVSELTLSRNKASRFKILFDLKYQVAAVFLGLLLLSSLIFLFPSENHLVKYATAYGEIKSITLPDNSTVLLNSNSSLSFYTNWDKNSIREVWIDGEAFFNVQKKPDLVNPKFTVYSNNLGIEVLGTQFNVNNRRGLTKVALQSGKVKLNNLQKNSDDTFMNPGELAEFSEDSGNIKKEKVEIELYTSWKHNKLIFNGSTLNEVARVLEDNYGFIVKIKDAELVERKFTGTFPLDNPDIILRAISESFKINVSSKNNFVLIEKHTK